MKRLFLFALMLLILLFMLAIPALAHKSQELANLIKDINLAHYGPLHLF